MCGIIGVFGGGVTLEEVQGRGKRLAHRGPDESGSYVNEKGVMYHMRLSIMDLAHGRHPIKGERETWVIHNGEIYNAQPLKDTFFVGKSFHTTCDTEIIVRLYENHKEKCLDLLDGVFSFIVMDMNNFFVARDPLGIKPLYYAVDPLGRTWFSSEMKALKDFDVKEFPPGHFFLNGYFERYYKPAWAKDPEKTIFHRNVNAIKIGLEDAVVKRMKADVPVAVLLSGGLDSSLIAAIAKRNTPGELHSFSVGMEGSPDILAARTVADYLGTQHHEVLFTFQEAWRKVQKAIYHMETYDVTTIRAGTPMLLLGEYIHSQGFKVVLSGEGSDEIFGGYLYFHNAPSLMEFHKECVERVERLHTADVLRADKSMMASAVEVRVPFLDKHFLSLAMSLHPTLKKQDIEKRVLRGLFKDYLPQEILWRQKEQFSDGVGYSWIDQLKVYADNFFTQSIFEEESARFRVNPPQTKEALLYRLLFDAYFPGRSTEKTVCVWAPKWQESTDPSGRVCDTHLAKPV